MFGTHPPRVDALLVTARCAERAGMRFSSATTVGGVTVVTGDVVRDDAPPEQRPVRGEIVSGEVVRDDDAG